MTLMTKLLEEAIARLRALPESDQDVAARFLLGFADPAARAVQIGDSEAAEVEHARREIREGQDRYRCGDEGRVAALRRMRLRYSVRVRDQLEPMPRAPA
jgi:hypothetical protein